MTADPPVSIVYIAGSGRTGSTLLSLLLAQSPGTWNVGQIRDLAKAARQDATCACGAPVRDCAFWGPVVAETGLGAPGAADRLNELRKDYLRHDPLRAVADGLHPYVRALRDLYVATSRAAAGRVLVDSSKTPEIAFGLSGVPGFHVTVVHLMRDPRAVACSWERKLGDRAKTVRFCGTWRERVRFVDRWAAAGGTPIVEVRYEDFARDPRSALARIRERAGLQEAPGLFADDGTAVISWDDQHLFPPANESVLARKETRVTIRPSDDWRALGNLPLHLVALRHTHPEGLRYCLPRWLPGSRAS